VSQRLAQASRRVRGKPGRPRTRPPAAPAFPAPSVAGVAPLAPRLVDLEGADQYLGGVSSWTVRDLIDNGTLARVRLPLPGGRELRRVLVDVRDLDALVAGAKDAEIPEP